MEQKDIDRLLAGRKIIDGIQRIDTTVLQEKYAAITKDQLPTLTKAEVVTAKEEVDALYEAEKQSILDAEKKLADLGFLGIGEFLDWNKEIVLNYFKENFVISGKCDLCGEKEFKNQPCYQKYSTAVCVSLNINPTDAIYQDVILRFKNRTITPIDNIYYGFCPKGHGFFADTDKITNPLNVDWAELAGWR